MFIIPAIDLLEGSVIRLKQGDYNQKTVYSNDPVAIAKKFAEQGAQALHIVDLDGARTGEMKNMEHILAIRECVNIHLQVGGGVRSQRRVSAILKCGIDQVVMSTAVLENFGFLQKMLNMYGAEHIVVSVDVKEGAVYAKGWVKEMNIEIGLLFEMLKNIGVRSVIYTDIIRDGMQTSPNYCQLQNIQRYGFQLIASGGVTSTQDIEQLEKMGVYGCIVGRAAYESDLLQSVILKKKPLEKSVKINESQYANQTHHFLFRH